MLLRVCQYTKCHINQYWYIMVYQCHGIVSLYLSYLFFVTFQIHALYTLPFKNPDYINTNKRNTNKNLARYIFINILFF
jgi:hypothetical protein